MPKLVEGALADGGRIVDDAWTAVDDAATLSHVAADAAVLATWALWRDAREALLARDAPLGVVLEPDADLDAVAADLPRLALVAVRFPKFTDGRGYSIARLLRERHGFRGSLRAVGDVQRDQLFLMLRCGFDAFALNDGASLDDALTAWRDFSEAYQSSVERPEPLFRRRLAGALAP